jgi:glycosyltransferase involved in cell wall biosynthesis
VVCLLCKGLLARGHRVTLFGAPGSCCEGVEVVEVLERADSERINFSLVEADHVARSFSMIDSRGNNGGRFDVVHDHSGFTALAMADRISVPMVHTLHGPVSTDVADFYARHGGKAALVAISRAQIELGAVELEARVVPNPIAVEEWPFSREKDGYLLWIGRMFEGKGPHRAIEVAHRTGMPLVLAGPVQPGQESFFETEVLPHVDGGRVRYVGEVGSTDKAQLFARAAAVLMPIRWPEPFGMVMTEALACGTPVLAFPEGSAPDIVEHGRTGFVVDDEVEMAEAVSQLRQIDPADCRAAASERFDYVNVAGLYEEAYLDAVRKMVRQRTAHRPALDRSHANPRTRAVAR